MATCKSTRLPCGRTKRCECEVKVKAEWELAELRMHSLNLTQILGPRVEALWAHVVRSQPRSCDCLLTTKLGRHLCNSKDAMLKNKMKN